MKNDDGGGTGTVSIVDANQAYGALKEALYSSGFSFERAMAGLLALLKDGGWRRVGAGYDDVNEFVRSLKLDQFKVVAEQRQEFARRVRELQPSVSNRAMAGALGVSKSTVSRDAGPNGPPGAAKAKGNVEAPGPNGPPGAGGGRRDAAIIVNRDTREERRAEKIASMSAAAELTGRFSIFYADPPWTDEFGFNGRGADLHYPVMSDAKIAALPVASVSADDAMLLLWAILHMFPTALKIMEAWGFSYRTHMVWAKDRIGLGAYVRNQHENLLIGRKGAFPTPPESLRVGSVITAPVGAHSAKPVVFLELIERWWPDAPKLEMFRRGPPREAWSAWGNEALESEGAP